MTLTRKPPNMSLCRKSGLGVDLAQSVSRLDGASRDASNENERAALALLRQKNANQS
jgi:hypothetical protein